MGVKRWREGEATRGGEGGIGVGELRDGGRERLIKAAFNSRP